MPHARRHFLKTVGKGTLAAGAWMAGAGCAATAARPALPAALPADDEAFWRIVRDQYPLTRERVYFNTGGLGPAPYPVLDAQHRTTLELQALSETGHSKIEAARAPVAAFLGAAPEEVAFMRNATEGNSVVASGLRLRAGDEVIFETHAHPGGAIPWLNRQKQDGIRVRLFEPDPASAAGNLERIEALITPRTRVIQVSHLTAPTGIRFPVEDIARLARDRGVWFHVDGAQSAGAFPFSLHAIGCDSYATSGHKWMGAPHGTGVLYVRRDRQDEVVPTEVGAYTDARYELPDVYDYHASARRYEPGTRDAASVVGIVAAVAFLERLGMRRVADYDQALARYLQEGLRALPGVTVLTPTEAALSAGITTYRVDTVPYDKLFGYLLSEHKLRCRVVTEVGLDALRVSTHVFNNRDECDRVIEGTRQARQTLGG